MGDFDRYLRGNGIDIGAGNDPLRVEVGSVRTWDKSDGDAELLGGIEDESYDFVYSSHCLEHLRNVPNALHHWARICKPGGVVYIVVPEWTLYEHRQWPSLHNPEHKCSFSVITCERPTGHPHFTVGDLVSIATGLSLSVREVRLDMDGFLFPFHRTESPFIDQTMAGAQAQLTLVFEKQVC